MTTSTGDSLCSEMSALMHDYETVSRMADLAASLRMSYPELASDTFRALLQSIQRSIQVTNISELSRHETHTWLSLTGTCPREDSVRLLLTENPDRSFNCPWLGPLARSTVSRLNGSRGPVTSWPLPCYRTRYGRP